jgi:anti-anti-sigma factor
VDDRPFRAVLTPDSGVLSLSGTVDELSIDKLREVLDESTHGHTRPLTVDLSDVDFLPSMALGVLISAFKAGEGQLTLTVSKRCIARRVLEVTGLPHLVT